MNQKVEVIEAGKTFYLSRKARLIILVAALIALATLVYAETLRALVTSVLHREGSSHGLFVPFISGYFLWLKREKIRQVNINFSLLSGAVIIAVALLILYFSRSSAEIAPAALSLIMVASGLILVLFGTHLFKEVAFPLLFLITMIPVPANLYNHIGEWMRQSVTTGSVWLTHLLQLPIYREGYSIQLPTTDIFIAMGCSGIRYLLSYFVFSLAYAYLCKNGFRGRAVVVLASFPIALVAGVLRLTSIYLAVYFIGPFMAGHWPHILLSWFVFLAVLVVAIAADQYLSGVWGQKSEVGGRRSEVRK